MNCVITTCTRKTTDILKRSISNVATFEKVRENSTGKNVRGKKYGNKITGKKSTWKKIREQLLGKDTGGGDTGKH